MPIACNQFIQLPRDYIKYMDPDHQDDCYVDKKYEPYQQKIHFEPEMDSSDIEGHECNSDEQNCLEALDQPFKTITRVGYHDFLNGNQIVNLARRSDVLITSTVSLSLFPLDMRRISKIKRSEMSTSELNNYIDEKLSFKALAKDHVYKTPQKRDKDKEFKDNYLCS